MGIGIIIPLALAEIAREHLISQSANLRREGRRGSGVGELAEFGDEVAAAGIRAPDPLVDVPDGLGLGHGREVPQEAGAGGRGLRLNDSADTPFARRLACVGGGLLSDVANVIEGPDGDIGTTVSFEVDGGAFCCGFARGFDVVRADGGIAATVFGGSPLNLACGVQMVDYQADTCCAVV